MAVQSLPTPEAVDAVLGDVVLYRAAVQDDVAEVVAFPLCAEVETFAAIVTRVHPRGAADLMILDPSKGPMPRWKVPFAMVPRPGHWTPKRHHGR